MDSAQITYTFTTPFKEGVQELTLSLEDIEAGKLSGLTMSFITLIDKKITLQS